MTTAFLRSGAALRAHLTPAQWAQATTSGYIGHAIKHHRWLIPLNPDARLIHYPRSGTSEDWCMGPVNGLELPFPDVALTRLAWLQADLTKVRHITNRTPRSPLPPTNEAQYGLLLTNPPVLLTDVALQRSLAAAMWALTGAGMAQLLYPDQPFRPLELPVREVPVPWLFPAAPPPNAWVLDMSSEHWSAEQVQWWRGGQATLQELNTALSAADFHGGVRLRMELLHDSQYFTAVRLTMYFSILSLERWFGRQVATPCPASLTTADWEQLQTRWRAHVGQAMRRAAKMGA